ncbi:MAG: transposase, partial [bacterium]
MKNRKKNRLLGYDYRQYGYYFVTICSNNRIKWFGNIENNHMVLNLSGQIVRQQLQWLEKRYSYIKLDEYIIMPNHIHGIIIIKNYVGNGRD